MEAFGITASSENIGDEHHQDQQWQNHSILLMGLSGESVLVGNHSDRGLTMGGWTTIMSVSMAFPKLLKLFGW